MIALAIKYWKPAAVLILLLIMSSCCYKAGSDATDARWSARWHQHVAEDATQVAESETAARVREQETLAAWAVANDIQHEELTNVQNHRDRLLADIRAGRLRLPTCPRSLPEAAADTGEPEAGAEGGFSGEFGEWLVSRAAVCDEVTTERNQAVRLLEGISAAGSR